MSSKSFLDLINKQQKSLVPNDLFKVKILKQITYKQKNYYLLDTNLKSDGILEVSELPEANIGDMVEVIILRDYDSYILMSHKKASSLIAMKKIKLAQKNRTKITGKFIKNKKMKTRVILFDEIFAIPDKNFIEPSEGVEAVDVVISKIIKNKYVLVMNYNHIDEEILSQNNINVGDVVDCEVTGFNNFMVFVNIKDPSEGGLKIDGIIHHHDLSFQKINFPGDILSYGQKIQAKVLKLKNNTVILGLKQAKKTVMKELLEKYKIGDMVKCTISEIKPKGLTVNLEDGLEAFIYISEISWEVNERKKDLSESFKVGQEIEGVICVLDLEKPKIMLSIKKMQENPFLSFVENFKRGDIIKGKVLDNPTEYGNFLFIQLVPGVDGILYKLEMSWNFKQCETKFNELSKGQEIEVMVHNIEIDKQKVSVSVKRIQQRTSSARRLEIGEIYDLQVIEVLGGSVVVSSVLYPEVISTIYSSNLSVDRSFTSKEFAVGQVMKAKLINYDKFKKSYVFSIRAYQQDQNNQIANNNNVKTSSESSFSSFLNK
jgi:small subunit ribosomal protein S1